MYTHDMTRRLQVLLDDGEWRQIERAARAEHTTVAAWVRRALRAARLATSPKDIDRKLAAIRAAVRHRFPAPDIDRMNAEIERGYLGEPPA
jgi:hypothetical protein